MPAVPWPSGCNVYCSSFLRLKTYAPRRNMSWILGLVTDGIGSGRGGKASRRRRKKQKRSNKLKTKGREEAEFSERATYICRYEWLKRSSVPTRKRRAHDMEVDATFMRSLCSKQQSKRLNREVIIAICDRLDTLSSQWSSLKNGEAISSIFV